MKSKESKMSFGARTIRTTSIGYSDECTVSCMSRASAKLNQSISVHSLFGRTLSFGRSTMGIRTDAGNSDGRTMLFGRVQYSEVDVCFRLTVQLYYSDGAL